jgi:DNA-binding MarR family transcriptional regulator
MVKLRNTRIKGNQARVIHVLKKQGKMTARMIIEETGEKKNVIKNALRCLIKKEMVRKIHNLSDMRCPYYGVKTAEIST